MNPFRLIPPSIRPAKVYAYEGERVTCENGHTIATVAKPIMMYDMPDGTELRGWKQTPPKIGDRQWQLYCHRCGADWVRIDDGQRLHFKGGWR